MSLWGALLRGTTSRSGPRRSAPAGRPSVQPVLAVGAVALMVVLGSRAGSSDRAGSPSAPPSTIQVVSADLAVQGRVDQAHPAAPSAPETSGSEAAESAPPAPTTTRAAVPITAAGGVGPSSATRRTPTDPHESQLAQAREWRDPGASPTRMVLVILGMALVLGALVLWLARRAR